MAASRALGIALTRRTASGAPLPMCGVPVSSRDHHVARLVRSGARVVVCEQMETADAARARGPGAVVRRAVTRVVTTGTVTEDALLGAVRAWMRACAQALTCV